MSVILNHPVVSPTTTVTLPNPLLGNQHELQPTRVKRKSRTGRIILFSDPAWPSKETLRWKFELVDEAKREEFFSFLQVSLGQEIKVTTHEAIDYVGVVINPDGESADFYRECGHTLELNLQVT